MVKFQDEKVFDDKISFFRMEYLLYCLRELSYLNKDKTELKSDIKYYEKKMATYDAEIQKLKFQNRGSAQKQTRSGKIEGLQRDYEKYFRRLKEIDEELGRLRRIIKQLVDHVIDWRVRCKRVYEKDHYGVPLSTYWRPLRFGDNIETDYEKES